MFAPSLGHDTREGGPPRALHSQNAFVQAESSPYRPVHMLPPELLANIFEEIAGTRPLPRLDRSWDDMTIAQQWIRVAWVCQYWRKIALSDPFLWGHIFLDEPRLSVDYGRTWVRRSVGAPLDVIIADIDFVDDLVLEVIFAEASRVRSLRVHHIRNNKLGRFSSADMSALQSLSLSRDEDCDEKDVTTVFGGRLSALRHLYLREITYLTSNSFVNLRSLRLADLNICGFDSDVSGKRSVVGLLTMLHASPGLRSCVFEHCILFEAPPSSSPAQYLKFPSLERLVLDQCSPSFQALILRRMDLSHDPTFPTHISIIHTEDLESTFPHKDISRIRLLQDATTFAFNLDLDFADAYIIGSSSALVIRQWEIQNDSAPYFNEQLNSVSSGFGNMRELWLSGESAMSGRRWRRFFSSLHVLAKLVIKFGAGTPQDRRWLLALGGEDPPGWYGTPFPAPALHTLVCLVRSSAHWALGRPWQDMLYTRIVRGHVLHRLHVLCEREAEPSASECVDSEEEYSEEDDDEMEKTPWLFRCYNIQEVHRICYEDVDAFPTVPMPEACTDLTYA